MVAVPRPFAVTLPVALTVATVGSEEAKLFSAMALSGESAADRVIVSLRFRLASVRLRTISSGAGRTVTAQEPFLPL